MSSSNVDPLKSFWNEGGSSRRRRLQAREKANQFNRQSIAMRNRFEIQRKVSDPYARARILRKDNEEEHVRTPDWFIESPMWAKVSLQELNIVPDTWVTTPRYSPRWSHYGGAIGSMAFAPLWAWLPGLPTWLSGLAPTYFYSAGVKALRAGYFGPAVTNSLQAKEWTYQTRSEVAMGDYWYHNYHYGKYLGLQRRGIEMEDYEAWRSYRRGQMALSLGKAAYWKQQQQFAPIGMGWQFAKLLTYTSKKLGPVRAFGFPFFGSNMRMSAGAAFIPNIKEALRENERYPDRPNIQNPQQQILTSWSFWPYQYQTIAEYALEDLGQWTLAQTAYWGMRDTFSPGFRMAQQFDILGYEGSPTFWQTKHKITLHQNPWGKHRVYPSSYRGLFRMFKDVAVENKDIPGIFRQLHKTFPRAQYGRLGPSIASAQKNLKAFTKTTKHMWHTRFAPSFKSTYAPGLTQAGLSGLMLELTTLALRQSVGLPLYTEEEFPLLHNKKIDFSERLIPQIGDAGVRWMLYSGTLAGAIYNMNWSLAAQPAARAMTSGLTGRMLLASKVGWGIVGAQALAATAILAETVQSAAREEQGLKWYELDKPDTKIDWVTMDPTAPTIWGAVGAPITDMMMTSSIIVDDFFANSEIKPQAIQGTYVHDPGGGWIPKLDFLSEGQSKLPYSPPTKGYYGARGYLYIDRGKGGAESRNDIIDIRWTNSRFKTALGYLRGMVGTLTTGARTQIKRMGDIWIGGYPSGWGPDSEMTLPDDFHLMNATPWNAATYELHKLGMDSTYIANLWDQYAPELVRDYIKRETSRKKIKDQVDSSEWQAKIKQRYIGGVKEQLDRALKGYWDDKGQWRPGNVHGKYGVLTPDKVEKIIHGLESWAYGWTLDKETGKKVKNWPMISMPKVEPGGYAGRIYTEEQKAWFNIEPGGNTATTDWVWADGAWSYQPIDEPGLTEFPEVIAYPYSFLKDYNAPHAIYLTASLPRLLYQEQGEVDGPYKEESEGLGEDYIYEGDSAPVGYDDYQGWTP